MDFKRVDPFHADAVPCEDCPHAFSDQNCLSVEGCPHKDSPEVKTYAESKQ